MEESTQDCSVQVFHRGLERIQVEKKLQGQVEAELVSYYNPLLGDGCMTSQCLEIVLHTSCIFEHDSQLLHGGAQPRPALSPNHRQASPCGRLAMSCLSSAVGVMAHPPLWTFKPPELKSGPITAPFSDPGPGIG